jgi:hypothetical protein
MPEPQLLAAYYEGRRNYVEKKFARDTQRARLDWMKARTFVTGSGGVTERMNAVSASEDLARKGQELREMTRDLDLLKADVDPHCHDCAAARRAAGRNRLGRTPILQPYRPAGQGRRPGARQALRRWRTSRLVAGVPTKSSLTCVIALNHSLDGLRFFLAEFAFVQSTGKSGKC